jgi:hypothetical protein
MIEHPLPHHGEGATGDKDMDLTTAAREMHELRKELAAHIDASKKREAELRSSINDRSRVLESAADGIDADKVALAKTIISIRGLYANGGDDRKSVISDAVKQLSTGSPCAFTMATCGTTISARNHMTAGTVNAVITLTTWGRATGSIIFSVELTDRVRKNLTYADLTPDEIEAAIYYLMNLERVQAAEQRAREVAAA